MPRSACWSGARSGTPINTSSEHKRGLWPGRAVDPSGDGTPAKTPRPLNTTAHRFSAPSSEFECWDGNSAPRTRVLMPGPAPGAPSPGAPCAGFQSRTGLVPVLVPVNHTYVVRGRTQARCPGHRPSCDPGANPPIGGGHGGHPGKNEVLTSCSSICTVGCTWGGRDDTPYDHRGPPPPARTA